MTFNSVVVLKGIRTPIILSEREARMVKKAYDDNKIPSSHVFDLDKISFSKGEIKFIELVKDGSVGEAWNDKIHKDNVEGWSERKEFLRKTPEEKSKYLDMFLYMFKISTDREPTPVETKRAEIVQMEFYKNNPTRTICDFHLLSPIVPKNEMKKRVNPFQISFFRVIENALMNDYVMSRKNYDD